ncbi:unnamed protein product [Arabidopsis halleri]
MYFLERESLLYFQLFVSGFDQICICFRFRFMRFNNFQLGAGLFVTRSVRFDLFPYVALIIDVSVFF